MFGVGAVPFDETGKIGPILSPIVEGIGAGEFLDIAIDQAGRGMVKTNGAVETQGLCPTGKVRDGHVIAENVPDPTQFGRPWRNLELELQQPLIMAFQRPQHHPVLSKGDRLLILIRGDMPNRENRHFCPNDLL
jgi:hypothetical protein